MKNIIKFILIYFILFNFNLLFVESIDPPSSEYNCLKTLVTKFKLSVAFVANTTGGYSFCTNTDVTCYTNGSISQLRLDWEPTTSTTVIQFSDFNCFPFLNYLSINKFTISSTLIYSKIPTVKTLVLSGSKGITTINNQIAKYDQITINSQDFNSVVKMSYLNGLKYITLGGGKITLDTDSLSNKTTLETFSFGTSNIPNMSGYSNLKYIQFSLNSGWNSASISNISTIDCISLRLAFPDTPSISFPKPFNSSKYFYYSIQATLLKPSSIIDLSGYTALKNIQILDPGIDFHIGGDLPIKLSSNTGLYWTGGALTKIPSITQPVATLEITGSTISASLPVYSGSIKYFDFSNNLITGSVGSTWCNANLVIKNNKLTGALPSCKYCYLNDSTVYSKFSGNSFTNLVTNPTCTTFAPKITVESTTLIITGTDIGTSPSSYWVLNTTLACSSWVSNTFALNYSCTIPNLNKVEYFWINFKQPNNKNFTFPTISKDPSLSSIIINNNRATITGKFFSSYLNYVTQTVLVGSTSCSIASSSFFEIQCTMTTTPAGGTQLVTVTTNSLVKKVYIKTTNALLNNKVCPNDCSGNSKGICDMSTALCQCNTGWQSLDCSIPYKDCPINGGLVCNGAGNCNNQTGVCNCDSTHQGSSCSIPFKQCPINGGLICSGAGSCNNQTGTCSCNSGRSLIDCSGYKCDTQNNCNGNGVCNESVGKCQCNTGWQSIDCSIPFKQCPYKDGLLCSGSNNQCNNQTGICTCDQNHQGLDCSLPFKQCPINNDGLLCSGSNNQCNNQTGVCICDQNHQGLSCEYPYLPCENDCSGLGLCDNKTSICTCIQGRIFSDCSGIQCKVPDCNNKGLCDTSSGVCACLLPYFGENCTFIQCSDPSCSNNGNCNVDIGKCDCELDYTGEKCNIANHYASSISSTNENGGNVTINGFFGEQHDNISIKIGNNQCELFEIKNDLIICKITPGQGIKNVTITQNNIHWIGNSFFQYIKDYSQSNECTVLCNLNNGKCNNSFCQCLSGFRGPDCNSLDLKTADSNNNDDEGLPNSEIIINNNNNSSSSNNGEIIIQNGSSRFNISIVALVEIDISGNQIFKYNLENNWELLNKSDNNIYYFNQKSNNTPTALITLIIEIITKDKIINFANIQYPVEKDSVKVNINISNYQYKSSLNTLQLHYRSSSQIADLSKDKCNNQNITTPNINTKDLESSLEKGSINHSSFITIQLQNRVFYSKLIDRVLSNGISTLATTSIIEKNLDSIILSINLPHGNDIQIDPNFSTLLSTNFIKDCNDNSKSYVLPISIALPIITVSTISAISIYYFKKRIKNKELNLISVKLSQIKNQ